MRGLLWAIPLFPLIGFLINGLVYLAVAPHERRAHGHGDGYGTDAHTAATAPDTSRDTGHDPGHHDIPFKGLHTVGRRRQRRDRVRRSPSARSSTSG